MQPPPEAGESLPPFLLWGPAWLPEEADVCGFEHMVRGGQPGRTDRCLPRLAETQHPGDGRSVSSWSFEWQWEAPGLRRICREGRGENWLPTPTPVGQRLSRWASVSQSRSSLELGCGSHRSPVGMLTVALGSDSGGNKLVSLCESTEAKNGPFQSRWLFPVSCPQACPHSHQGLQHSRSEVYRGRSTNSKGHLEEITKRVNPIFPLPSQTRTFLPIDWPLTSPHISPV